MIDGLVTSRSVEGADPFVEGILSKRDRSLLLVTSQATINRFPDDRGDTHTAPQGLVAQLAVGLLREAQVGDDVAGHDGITISRYRQCGKWRPDPQCGKWRPDPPVQFRTTLIGVDAASGSSSLTRNRWPSAVTQ